MCWLNIFILLIVFLANTIDGTSKVIHEAVFCKMMTIIEVFRFRWMNLFVWSPDFREAASMVDVTSMLVPPHIYILMEPYEKGTISLLYAFLFEKCLPLCISIRFHNTQAIFAQGNFPLSSLSIVAFNYYIYLYTFRIISSIYLYRNSVIRIETWTVH